MAKLYISETALADLKEIQRYIARDKPVAARNWIARIRRKCRLLAKNPELGDLRDDLGKGVRCSYLCGYCIFLGREGNMVKILRVVRDDRDITFL